MVQTVNALGDACPIPVVKTRKAIAALQSPATVEVLVDNEVAVQNLTKMANQQSFPVRSEKRGEKEFCVTIEVNALLGDAAKADETPVSCVPAGRKKKVVVAVSSAHMGNGSDELGAILMKSFLFALTQQEELPSAVIFYNGGASLTTEGSASLEDLKSLEAQGVEILTCGTCLNFYGLTEKLKVGGVSNMYEIVEKLTGADLVVRP